MIPDLIEKENHLNALLPPQRLETSPSDKLLDAAIEWSQAVWSIAEKAGPMALSEDELNKGLRLAQRPVYICGVHRSGTTLLRNLLDGHPELLVLPSEGTYFTNLEFQLRILPEDKQARFLGTEWLRRLANPINQPPYWLLGRSSATCSPYVDFARYLMAWWRAGDTTNDDQWPHMAVVLAYACITGKPDATSWVDKTPTNERFLTRIWQETPNAKVIHIIREPVAAITSRKKMEPSLNIRSALIDLNMSYRVAAEQSQSGDPCYLLVRYEELCENSDDVIKRISSFLDIGVLDILSVPTVAGVPVVANSVFANKRPPGQILKASQHPQEKMLNKTERELLAAYVGPLANQLNYHIARVGLMRRCFIWFKYRLLALIGR